MTIRVEQKPPVLYATIDRAQTLNAIDFGAMEELEDAVAIAEKDASYRAFVITGAGSRAFVSGGDLRKFARLESREQVGMMALRMRVILERMEEADFWTVAAVNGPAFGGGCELLLACDFRIAAEEATFGFTQSNFAVPPGWGGLTRLVETVGKTRALLWLAEGAVVDSPTALATGLIHDTVPRRSLEARTRSLCSKLVDHDRKLIRALKRGVRNAHTLPRKESIESELSPFVECWLSDEHRTRVDAFLQQTK